MKTAFPNLMTLLLGTSLIAAHENIFFQAYVVYLNPIQLPCDNMRYKRIGTVVFEPKGLILSTRDSSGTMKSTAWYLNKSNKIWTFDEKGLFG